MSFNNVWKLILYTVVCLETSLNQAKTWTASKYKAISASLLMSLIHSPMPSHELVSHKRLYLSMSLYPGSWQLLSYWFYESFFEIKILIAEFGQMSQNFSEIEASSDIMASFI